MALHTVAENLLSEDVFDDPLVYLRRSGTTTHPKNQIIFHAAQPASRLYLVTEGKVAVSRHSPEGRKLLVDIYRADEFFGESALVEPYRHSEEAVAFEDARVMSWTVEDLVETILAEPRLGVALLRFTARRSLELTHRVESLSVEPIGRRLARALVRFSHRLGTPGENGIVRLPAVTHDLLGQYIGTSREIVTQHMNQFRRLMWVKYSRVCIQIERDKMEAWLNSPPQPQNAGQSPALRIIPSFRRTDAERGAGRS